MATEASPGLGAPGSGPVLPGFRLLGVFGQGGMGVVYRAEQASPRRQVAVKLLHAGARTAETMEAFRREASLIASLEYPHIVPLYAFGEHGGQPFLVFRWLRGGSAAARLAQGSLDVATAAGWVGEIAAALDFAHKRGLVHRDVKPSNILLDEAGHAYLTDFGIAGAMADQSSAGAATGSAAYMAPEQGRGEAVDHRADIYALAVTLFELLTGQKPYMAETALGVIVRHIHDPIPSAREINPAIPAAVGAVIRRGMAKDAADRYQSAGDLGLALRSALGLSPTAVLEPTMLEASAPAIPARTVMEPVIAPPRAAPVARRTRPAGMWIGLIVVGVCGMGGLLLAGGLGLAAILTGATPIPNTAVAQIPTGQPTVVAAGPTWLLADDFSDPESGFVTLSDEDGGVAYLDGALRITVLTEDIEWRPTSRRVDAQDVSVSVSVTPRSGPDGSDWGVLCRWLDRDNYVALAVSGDGQAAIWRSVEREIEVLAGARDAGLSLSQDTPVVLSATCAGDSVRLESGGRLLAEATDPAPAAGDVGLLARLREPGDLIVDFDDLVVTKAE